MGGDKRWGGGWSAIMLRGVYERERERERESQPHRQCCGSAPPPGEVLSQGLTTGTTSGQGLSVFLFPPLSSLSFFYTFPLTTSLLFSLLDLPITAVSFSLPSIYFLLSSLTITLLLSPFSLAVSLPQQPLLPSSSFTAAAALTC